MSKFSVEKMYQDYLKRVNLNPKEMGSIQRQETRRAFMGGASALIAVLYSEGISKSDEAEQEAIEAMPDIVEELKLFWEAESL